MNKKRLINSLLAAIIFSVSTTGFAEISEGDRGVECIDPEAVIFPDGNVATAAQMVSAEKAVHLYEGQVREQLFCLKGLMKMISASGSGLDGFVSYYEQKKINLMDDMENLVAAYAAQMEAYNQANQ